jgi:hypothetical protein
MTKQSSLVKPLLGLSGPTSVAESSRQRNKNERR